MAVGWVSVLIVDDDSSLVESMKLILENRGYEVDTAGSAREASEKIESKSYDVVILDIVLPDASGIDLLRKFDQTRVPRTRKIILTGHATLENAIEALNLDADAYLLKPVSPEALLKAISDQVQKQQQEIRLLQEKIIRLVEMDAEERIRRIAEEKYL